MKNEAKIALAGVIIATVACLVAVVAFGFDFFRAPKVDAANATLTAIEEEERDAIKALLEAQDVEEKAILEVTIAFLERERVALELELTPGTDPETDSDVPDIASLPSTTSTPKMGNTPTGTPTLTKTATPNAPLTPKNTPTETPSATYTTAPSPTVTPEPAIDLPFIDNFDSPEGASNSWTPLNGTWIVGDGRYTVFENDGWFWSMLNEPTWANYRVTVNVFISNIGSVVQGAAAVAVRAEDLREPFLAYRSNYPNYGSGWALVERNGDTDFITGPVNGTISDYSTWELEVNGNQFIARVDGVEIQRVNFPGYDSGGVALGMFCRGGCPSYDDFKIEPIP